MTITLQAVNELIASLESAGELSIKEQKYLGLAKAFKQLAAENVALNGALTGSAYISFIKANGWNTSASTVNGKFVNFADPEVDFGSMVFAHAKKLIEAVETPATDRIVAGIKADESKFIFQSILDNPAVADLGSLVDWLEQHANDSAAAVQAMREGADK